MTIGATTLGETLHGFPPAHHPKLALLGLGGEEIFLIVALFLLLFGVQKAPEIARQLGRARAEMERARAEVAGAMRSEDEKELDAQLAFERAREHQIQQQDVELVQLRAAAAELGLDVDQAATKDDLRRAIGRHVAGGTGGADGANGTSGANGTNERDA